VPLTAAFPLCLHPPPSPLHTSTLTLAILTPPFSRPFRRTPCYLIMYPILPLMLFHRALLAPIFTRYPPHYTPDPVPCTL
jgi:hypothetical protein